MYAILDTYGGANMHKKVMIVVDPEVVKKMRPYLLEDDLSFSAWVRKAMRDYMSRKELYEVKNA